MSSSTGMTVAIASPRAGWAPLSRRCCPEGAVQKVLLPFRADNERVPQSETPVSVPRGRTARFPAPAAMHIVTGVPHATGRHREPTMLSQEKPERLTAVGMRFDVEGRCREFTEWYGPRPPA